MQIRLVTSVYRWLGRLRPTVILAWFTLFAMTLSLSCGNEGPGGTGTPAGNGSMTTAPLQIHGVDVLIAESYPPRVSVKVNGIIPDSCTKAREPVVSRDGSTFTITIIGERPTGVACAQIISPYDQSIEIGTLDPGSYTVVVNGVRKNFSVS